MKDTKRPSENVNDGSDRTQPHFDPRLDEMTTRLKLHFPHIILFAPETYETLREHYVNIM